MTACVGQPLSWLTLERHALAELPAAAAAAATAHLATCASCRAALASIAGDARVLPPLPVAAVGSGAAVGPRPVERRRRWAAAGVALAAAAALLLLWFVRDPDAPRRGGGELTRAVRVKGAGVVALTLVRERDGAIAFDPPDVRAGDRWKVQLGCAPGGAAWVDVVVYQAGAAAAFPLPAYRLACGNGVVVPGAFRITGGAATVCARLTPDAPSPPARAAVPAAPVRDLACATLTAAP